MAKIKEVNFTEGNLSKENLYPLIFKALDINELLGKEIARR